MRSLKSLLILVIAILSILPVVALASDPPGGAGCWTTRTDTHATSIRWCWNGSTFEECYPTSPDYNNPNSYTQYFVWTCSYCESSQGGSDSSNYCNSYPGTNLDPRFTGNCPTAYLGPEWCSESGGGGGGPWAAAQSGEHARITVAALQRLLTVDEYTDLENAVSAATGAIAEEPSRMAQVAKMYSERLVEFSRHRP